MQEACLTSCIDLNKKPKRKAICERFFEDEEECSFLNSYRKWKKCVETTTEKRKNYLISEANFNFKIFAKKHINKKYFKMKIQMKKLICLGLSILDISIIAIL